MTYDEFLNFLDQFEEIKSFAGRQKFADQHLQRIGSGTGRIVYDIDGEKVFKIAKNAKGVAQNDAESDVGRYQDTHNIVTKIFEFDNNGAWIIAEKGKKVNESRIKELTGIPSLNDLFYFLRNYEEQSKGKREIFHQEKEKEEFFWENEFAQDLSNLVSNYSQSSRDMGKQTSYGEVLRDGQPTIVLTDYGLSDEVYGTHYDRSRKQKYQMYEIYGVQHGNTDHLSDIGNVGAEVRQGMWALVPHGIGNGGDNINENFVSFIVNRELYPKQPTSKLPMLSEIFHHCINNLHEILNKVDNKKGFYSNLLKLQEYLIEQKYYDWDELKYEEYSINEDENKEIPKVQPYTLDNKEYAIALANAAAEKLNLGDLKYLASGGFGFAFEINNDLVFKLTSDISEADAAVKLFRGEPQTIAKVYYIYKIVDVEKNLSFFGIIQENIQNKPVDKFRTYQDTIDKIKPSGMDFVSFILYSKKVNKIGYEEVVNTAKTILTDNPELNVSNELRQETLNFMIGLVNIRKELLELGIKSDDYSEIKNLGYKDGVLKFFDVGGYISTEPDIDDSNIIRIPESVEISEEYNMNTAISIANQIASKLNINKPTPIKGGNFGVAFDIGSDKILKITKDNSEAAENLMLIGKPLKYIAQPYNVYEIQPKKDEAIPKTWAIILEKLDTNPNIKRQYDRLEFAFNKILGVGIPDVIEHYLGEWDNSKVNKNKINSYLKKNPQDAKFFDSLLRIAEETKSYGIASMDYLNSSNLGYKKNGVLGFFDVGFGDGFLQPKNLEKIEVDEDGSSRFSTDSEMGQDGFPPYNNNDTSPSIQNDLNANSNLYTEDLEYSKVSDATEDEYIMDERKKAWIPGSVAVEVKKKCRLGGLGTTSVACNQGDINNLTFKKLNEIGEANVDVYPVEIDRSDELVKIYEFTTEDNDNYFLEFVKANEDDNMWRMDFGLLNPNNLSQTFTNVVNKGRIYRVMATILKVLRGFFTNTNPDILVIEPTKTKSKEDNRRFSLYLQYIKKHLPNEYEYTVDSKEIIIKRKKKDLTESQILTLNQLPFKNDVQERGGKIFSVGGAVRDEFLGKDSKDLDILISGIPMEELEQILSNYGRVDAVGKSFGILKFKPKGGEEIDIAIPRTEKPSGDGGHKGFDITSDHALPIEKDLERRDFTINAIAKDIDGNIIDPFGGQEDLKNKIIRVVNPEAFSDDPLRMLRAIQFSSRFGFTIEPQTMEMIKNNANRIKEIPTERILTEFGKIVFKGNKRMGVQLLKDTGLFQQIFGFDIKQSTIDRSPFEDVKTMGEFIFLITRLLENPAEYYKNNLRGEIDTFKEIKALQLAYQNHDALPIVARSIAHNMYLFSPNSLKSEILPSTIDIGANELLQGKYPKTVNELAVSGNDLMSLGLNGREIGDAQKSLLMKVYGNYVRNNKEELLNLVRQ